MTSEIRQEWWHIKKTEKLLISNANCSIVFLITGKWVKFSLNAFFTLEYDSEIGNMLQFVQKLKNLTLFFFLRFLISPGPSLHEFYMCYGWVFSIKNLLHH